MSIESSRLQTHYNVSYVRVNRMLAVLHTSLLKDLDCECLKSGCVDIPYCNGICFVWSSAVGGRACCKVSVTYPEGAWIVLVGSHTVSFRTPSVHHYLQNSSSCVAYRAY
jgi:hypothetical protein